MTLAKIFTDNMVIQRNKPIKIFGYGNEKVLVSLNGIVGESENKDNKWIATLPPMKEGGPYKLYIDGGAAKIELSNILIGDVWIVAGQSNAEYPLLCDLRGVDEAASCDNANIRFYTCNRGTIPEHITYYCRDFGEPEKNEFRPWAECNEKSALEFSAIGYYISKTLHNEINVPIGVISANKGGVPIETFIPEEAMNTSLFKVACDEFEKNRIRIAETDEFVEAFAKRTVADKEEWDTKKYSYENLVREMGHQAAQVVSSNYKKIESIPVCKYHPSAPSLYYNKMIKGQIAPLAVKGVIWYQGESNSHQPDGYCEKFRIMVDSWRELFNDENLPFYTVEIAPFKYPEDRGAYIIRSEQQKAAREIENCYIATSQNLGDETDIHPLQKAELASRVARQILHNEYGAELPCEGPRYKRYEVHDDEVWIYVENGKGLVGYDNENMKLAGKDGVYKAAEVEVKEDKIVAKSKEIKNPVSARYCYENYYKNAHIYNEAGIPLAPFITEEETF